MLRAVVNIFETDPFYFPSIDAFYDEDVLYLRHMFTDPFQMCSQSPVYIDQKQVRASRKQSMKSAGNMIRYMIDTL